MARIPSADAEHQAVHTVANLMVAAARTAPKARGIDSISAMVVDGADIEELAKAMDEVAPGRPELVTKSIVRDARNVRNSRCVVLIGVTGTPKKPENPLDCGACGFKTCASLSAAREKAAHNADYSGPSCVFATLDLGAALGSAVKVASDHNVDNRMMYTVGIGAKKLNWMDADVILGIPLSTSGKSIYFDRG
ncbi:MAG: hypothetical protein JXA58_04750 [Dehalococcoidia bacterium]|nr:hypothetical protein [Dehalococcoidia bacterium]